MISVSVSAGQALQAGEGGHLGDDSEAPGDHAASAGSHVCSDRPANPQQISGRLQRMCRRSGKIPGSRASSAAKASAAPGQLPQRLQQCFRACICSLCSNPCSTGRYGNSAVSIPISGYRSTSAHSSCGRCANHLHQRHLLQHLGQYCWSAVGAYQTSKRRHRFSLTIFWDSNLEASHYSFKFSCPFERL